MKLNIDILIVSDGHSGIVLQNKLFSIGHRNSIIIQKNQKQGYIGKDVIMFSKQKLPITENEPFEIHTKKHSSGAMDFLQEYSIKIYNRDPKIKIPYKDSDVYEGYLYDNSLMIKDLQSYGNIDIDSISLDKNKMVGHVISNNETVVIHYNKLCFANGIHKLQNLTGISMLEKFGFFISYYPVGIKKIKAFEHSKIMNIEYFSDPNIPYYRKHHFKDDILYEYCLNKNIADPMGSVISPGRFAKPDFKVMNDVYDFFLEKNVYLVGRFATWEPDYLLEHIWEPDIGHASSKILIKLYEDIK